jgi:hypothetical protein
LFNALIARPPYMVRICMRSFGGCGPCAGGAGPGGTPGTVPAGAAMVGPRSGRSCFSHAPAFAPYPYRGRMPRRSLLAELRLGASHRPSAGAGNSGVCAEQGLRSLSRSRARSPKGSGRLLLLRRGSPRVSERIPKFDPTWKFHRCRGRPRRRAQNKSLACCSISMGF